MKRIRTLCVLAACAAGAIAPVQAQTFPAKPVRFLVGFAAGGPTDVIARLVAQDMTQTLGQSVLVENRAGANAIVATEAVAHAAPDGHTALFSSLSLLVNVLLPMVVVTAPNAPFGSMKELAGYAKARNGQVSYGTSGIGGSSHLAGAWLESMTDTRMINVPFKGNGPALTEVMAGRVSFMFYPIVGIAEQVAAKKIKVLAVGADSPDPDFPGVPTMAQAGFPELVATAPWVGLLAPAGTPTAIVNRLSEEMRKSLARPETRQRMKGLGAVVVADTPAEFAGFLRKDYERWDRVIKASGVTAE